MIDSIFVADLFELTGGILIAYTVIAVHHRILHDKKVDKEVLKVMKNEQVLAGFGILLLIIGFIVRYFV